MTRKLAVLAYDLAVAVISIGLFIAALLWLSAREITALDALLLLIGSATGAVVGILKFQGDKEPWPVAIFRPVEIPAQKTVRPSLRFVGWTGSAQRA